MARNTIENDAALWHSAFYTKKAWEKHYQATQIINEGYAESVKAIVTSRYVRYDVNERVRISILKAKNATSMAYNVKQKALKLQSETLQLVAKTLMVVNNSLKMEKMIGANSKYLKKKQKRHEKRMRKAKEEEKIKRKKNDNAVVNIKFGEEKDTPLVENARKKKRRFNFNKNKWEKDKENAEEETTLEEDEDND